MWGSLNTWSIQINTHQLELSESQFRSLESCGYSFSFRNLPFSCVSLIFLLQGNALYFKSARNVTVNILNDQTKVLTQLITGKTIKNVAVPGPCEALRKH